MLNLDPQRRAMRDAIGRELQAIGEDIVAAAATYLDRRNINVDGDLRNSIRARVDDELAGLTLTVGPNVPHAIFVHEGTRPHFPPTAPIRRWVVKKLNVTGSDVAKVTAMVQRKIGRRGTEAKPFMRVALRLYRNQIVPRIAAAIQSGLDKVE